MAKKVTDAERTLFEQAMSDVRPLKPKNVRTPEPPRRRPARQVVAPLDAAPPSLTLDDVEPLQSGDLLNFARGGVQPNVLRNMRRGRVDIAASLDLHGLTASNAQNVLRHFLAHCIACGHRTVRIVHGKGHGTKDIAPVLKSIVNHWLREQTAVLAFCSAPPNDGGVGAVYVLLKRSNAI